MLTSISLPLQKASVIKDVRNDIEEGAREISKRAQERQLRQAQRDNKNNNNNKKKKKNKPPTTKKGKNSQCRFDSIRTSEIAKEMRMWRKELRQRESKVSLVLKFILNCHCFSFSVPVGCEVRYSSMYIFVYGVN